jgi:hypothetical protein
LSQSLNFCILLRDKIIYLMGESFVIFFEHSKYLLQFLIFINKNFDNGAYALFYNDGFRSLF